MTQEQALLLLDPVLDLQVLRPTRWEAMALLRFATRPTSTTKTSAAKTTAKTTTTTSLADAWDAVSSGPAFERLSEEQRLLAPTSAEGWLALTGIFRARRDLASLQRLETALASAHIDTTDQARRHSEWRPEDNIARATVQLARVEKMQAKDQATRGAILALRASALQAVGAAKGDVASLDAALNLAIEAEAAWPALDLRMMRASILGRKARIAIAAAGNAEAASADVVRLSDDDLVIAMAAGRFTSLTPLLLARPEWAQAVALRAAVPRTEPSRTSWAIATLSGDTTAAEAERARFSELDHVVARMSAVLSPVDPETADWLVLMKQIKR